MNFTPFDVFGAVEEARQAILEAGAMNDAGLSADTWMALGYALGVIEQARALILRDMDDEHHRQQRAAS